jgi:hypothetical protein
MHYTFAVIAESLEILEVIYCTVHGGVKLCYFGPLFWTRYYHNMASH